MKKANVSRLVLLLIAVGLGFAVKAQDVKMSELTGRWKLVKVEEVQQRGGVEVSRASYTPAQYPGEIYFEQVKCLANGTTTYSGKCNSGLSDGGNVQLNDNGNEVIFHGKNTGFHFDFSWKSKPISFILSQKQNMGQQQGAEVKLTQFYYEKL